jgi:hypothetical protein
VISSGCIARWIVAVGMCCLTALGAAPRLDCLCPNAQCQMACKQPLANNVCAPVSESDQQLTCCCHHEPKPAPKSDDVPVWHNSGCHCQMHVVQNELLSAVRIDGKLPPPVAQWLASDHLSLSLCRAELRPDRSQFTGLPPDDPVSRAQILRI